MTVFGPDLLKARALAQQKRVRENAQVSERARSAREAEQALRDSQPERVRQFLLEHKELILASIRNDRACFLSDGSFRIGDASAIVATLQLEGLSARKIRRHGVGSQDPYYINEIKVW
tara:strand:- start:181 stop:534 length:354 start_codon:yes stop_codon:yes gene_type:complete